MVVGLFLVGSAFSQSDTPCGGGGAPAIPVNSTCVNSTVTINGADNYQSNAANFGAVTCGSSGEDVWYSFVAPASGSVNITTTSGTITDAVMALYESDCSTYSTLIDCDDDGGTGLMPLISASGLTPGQTYYIRFWEYGGGTGNFEVCVTEVTSSNNQDCVDATAICDNNSFSGNSNGSGSVSDLNAGNDGCLSGENESSWYTFTVDAGGTLDMTISPVNGTDDYDFAIWGPNPTCPPTSSPIRCSYAAGGGDTGMANGSGDNSESAFGDKWVEDINVLAGETYIMVIDNYSSTTSPFDLTWGGTADLDCSILPIELVGFFAYNEDGYNKLSWITMSEIENESFIIERSENGKDWEVIGEIAGAGNSSYEITYDFRDKEYKATINYYRLTQVDYNGDFERSKIVSVDNRDPKEISRIVNFMGQTVDEDYQGLRIIIYNDGSTEKRVGK